MCLSELQAGLNEDQPLFPTHALCIRRSQQHRSPSAGIDFRGAFRILNIRELHQRNWYLAQYIPAGKNREHLFSWLSEQHVLPWTPLILKKVRRTDKVCGYRRHIHAVGRMLRPVAFSLIHPASLESSEVEEIFRDEGFILAHGRECSLNGSGRNMLSRILHVGHSGLPKAEWGIDHSNHLLH